MKHSPAGALRTLLALSLLLGAAAAAPTLSADDAIDLSKVKDKVTVDLRRDQNAENFYMVVFLTRNADVGATSPGHSYVATMKFRTDVNGFVEYGDPHLFGLYPKDDKVLSFGDVPGEMRVDPVDADPQQVLFAWVNQDQVSQVFKVRDDWAGRGTWNANDGDCVGFMIDVAKTLGMKVPERNTIWPGRYMEELRKANR